MDFAFSTSIIHFSAFLSWPDFVTISLFTIITHGRNCAIWGYGGKLRVSASLTFVLFLLLLLLSPLLLLLLLSVDELLSREAFFFGVEGGLASSALLSGGGGAFVGTSGGGTAVESTTPLPQTNPGAFGHM